MGAYFNKSIIEIGHELEDQQFENWKKWALREVATTERVREAAYSGVSRPDITFQEKKDDDDPYDDLLSGDAPDAPNVPEASEAPEPVEENISS